MIALENVTQIYRTESGESVVAVKEVSLEVADGEILCVVGPSGCGKSTLLRILAGFLPASRGRVVADEQLVREPDPQRGMVFQQPTLLPWYSVGDNVGLAHRYSTTRGERGRAEQLIDLVGLGDAADRFPHELSGGMQQRAQIARVLAANPRYVLMDEPFGALDPFTREQLQAELLRVWSRVRPTIIFVTHSVEEALLLGHRVVVMAAHPGRVVEEVAVPESLWIDAEDVSRETVQAQLRDLTADPTFVALRHKVTAAITVG